MHAARPTQLDQLIRFNPPAGPQQPNPAFHSLPPYFTLTFLVNDLILSWFFLLRSVSTSTLTLLLPNPAFALGATV
ncbi:hypothetical protein NLJ89_g11643 [Agrocybe chaxingu]|uniref:Uncharacterized protein n=1 Tax=Agrocybe chaxingu TaxID=84603 RepID=A0A9W8JNC2_9AGAR|nr:hypothetical protein NLJ89_g11643 [Agrocybe chaxingu]